MLLAILTYFVLKYLAERKRRVRAEKQIATWSSTERAPVHYTQLAEMADNRVVELVGDGGVVEMSEGRY